MRHVIEIIRTQEDTHTHTHMDFCHWTSTSFAVNRTALWSREKRRHASIFLSVFVEPTEATLVWVCNVFIAFFVRKNYNNNESDPIYIFANMHLVCGIQSVLHEVFCNMNQ